MDLTAEQQAMALRLADRHACLEIELGGILHKRIAGGVGALWDVSPMLDGKRHCDAVIAMNMDALEWAEARGLIELQPGNALLVKLVRHPQ